MFAAVNINVERLPSGKPERMIDRLIRFVSGYSVLDPKRRQFKPLLPLKLRVAAMHH